MGASSASPRGAPRRPPPREPRGCERSDQRLRAGGSLGEGAGAAEIVVAADDVVAVDSTAAAALRHLHGEVIAALDVREERSLIKGRRGLDDRRFPPVRCGARNSRLLDGLKDEVLPPSGSTGDTAGTG